MNTYTIARRVTLARDTALPRDCTKRVALLERRSGWTGSDGVAEPTRDYFGGLRTLSATYSRGHRATEVGQGPTRADAMSQRHQKMTIAIVVPMVKTMTVTQTAIVTDIGFLERRSGARPSGTVL